MINYYSSAAFRLHQSPIRWNGLSHFSTFLDYSHREIYMLSADFVWFYRNFKDILSCFWGFVYIGCVVVPIKCRN